MSVAIKGFSGTPAVTENSPAFEADRLFSERVHPNHPSRPAVLGAIRAAFMERSWIIEQQGTTDPSTVRAELFKSTMKVYAFLTPMMTEKQFQNWIGADRSVINFELFLIKLESDSRFL